MKRTGLKRAGKKKTNKRAKLKAEPKEQPEKKKPFLTIMSKLRRGMRLTHEEQVRLDRALRMAKRGSRNQWGINRK
jgi:hypothetical protein